MAREKKISVKHYLNTSLKYASLVGEDESGPKKYRVYVRLRFDNVMTELRSNYQFFRYTKLPDNEVVQTDPLQGSLRKENENDPLNLYNLFLSEEEMSDEHNQRAFENEKKILQKTIKYFADTRGNNILKRNPSAYIWLFTRPIEAVLTKLYLTELKELILKNNYFGLFEILRDEVTFSFYDLVNDLRSIGNPTFLELLKELNPTLNAYNEYIEASNSHVIRLIEWPEIDLSISPNSKSVIDKSFDLAESEVYL